MVQGDVEVVLGVSDGTRLTLIEPDAVDFGSDDRTVADVKVPQRFRHWIAGQPQVVRNELDRRGPCGRRTPGPSQKGSVIGTVDIAQPVIEF